MSQLQDDNHQIVQILFLFYLPVVFAEEYNNNIAMPICQLSL